MQQLVVNRFKTYRKFRWNRSDYLWKPEHNKFLDLHGISVLDDASTPADVLVIPCPHLPGNEDFAHLDTGISVAVNHRGSVDYHDIPIVCDSSLDYAYLDPTVRELLMYPQVRCYFPNVSFRNQLAQQRQSWGGEYYGHVFSSRMFFNAGPSHRIERENLLPHVERKIKPVNRPPTRPFTDEVFEYIAAKVQPLQERDIDVFFSGREVYAKSLNFPTMHRQELIRHKWDKLPGSKVLVTYDDFHGTLKDGQPVNSFKYPYEYVDVLLRSKIVISPWGWSSWCVRDLEALACGCLVIKPFCGNTLIYPDIYDPQKQFFIWADIRFEHIAEQLEYCYTNLDELQFRADRARAFLFDALYPNDKLYSKWTADLRLYLEEAMERKYEMVSAIPLKNDEMFYRR